MTAIAFKKLMNETTCLRIISVACMLIALFALTAGVLTHSTALLLDGTLCLFDVALSFVILFVVGLLRETRHHNKLYPYGYFKIEPLIVAVQSIVIIAVCLLSLFHTVKDLFHHTIGIRSYAWGFYYTLFTIFLDMIIVFYISRVNKKESSPFLELQLTSWKYGLCLGLGLFLGFFISYYFEHSSVILLKALSQYVDAAMTLLVVLFIIKRPMFLFIRNVEDLVDRSPRDEAVEKKVSQIIKEVISTHFPFLQIDSLKIRKAGRAYFISIVCLGDEKTTLLDIQTINKMIQAKMIHMGKNYYIDIIPKLKNQTPQEAG